MMKNIQQIQEENAEKLKHLEENLKIIYNLKSLETPDEFNKRMIDYEKKIKESSKISDKTLYMKFDF